MIKRAPVCVGRLSAEGSGAGWLARASMVWPSAFAEVVESSITGEGLVRGLEVCRSRAGGGGLGDRGGQGCRIILRQIEGSRVLAIRLDRPYHLSMDGNKVGHYERSKNVKNNCNKEQQKSKVWHC